MASHGRILIMQLSFVEIVVLLAAAAVTQALPPQALPNCADQCGNLTIPYPFGMAEGCYYKGKAAFFINCSQEAGQPPIPYLTKGGNVIVTNISLADGELQILGLVGRDCYDDQANIMESFASVDQNSCNGVGCCETNIPSGLSSRTVRLDSYNNHSGIWEFNPCSYAFIVEQDYFTFNNESFEQLKNTEKLPLVLNWEIGDEPCEVAQANTVDFVCKANSNCVNRSNITSSGYFCQCFPGIEGNPYHPDGCKDIDECKINSNLCKIGECVNSPPGNYSCLCPKGYKNDSMNGWNCIKDNPRNQSKKFLLLIISLGISVGFLLLLVVISWIYWGIKKRKFTKLKEKYFEENGGLLLQQQLASHGGSMETTKIFTAEELEKATNNYRVDEILGEGGYGTVYKGTL